MKTKYSFSSLARRAKATLFLSFIIGLAATAPRTLQAASPSELLEQGIYAEETKGDLDAAMRAYQQVVAEAKTSEALAAQAQYRLGLCHYKKKDYTAARAAFEKLVNDFPNQKELVKLASEYLSGATYLLSAPWANGEEMRLDLKSQTGYKVGFVRYSVEAGTLDGRKIWRFGSRLSAGVQQASRVEVDADSCKPMRSRWKHTVLGDADTVYVPGRAEVKLVQADGVKTYELDGVCYDNEEVVQLIRRLPLAVNYNTTLRVFTSLGGGNTVPIKLEVNAIEKITVPAGTFECFRIKLSPVNQTFWYSTDEHRYLVKFDAGVIVAELTGVETRPAGQVLSDSDFDFTLGEAGGGVPTIRPLDSQPPQNQAKLLILAAFKLPQLPAATDWCDALKRSGFGGPTLATNTLFAMNAQVAGRKLMSLPTDTVVFFETATAGWNLSGGAELLAKKTSGVAVAFADGRALLVDPVEAGKLRWAP
jgi:hypothetical protein